MYKGRLRNAVNFPRWNAFSEGQWGPRYLPYVPIGPAGSGDDLGTHVDVQRNVYPGRNLGARRELHFGLFL